MNSGQDIQENLNGIFEKLNAQTILEFQTFLEIYRQFFCNADISAHGNKRKIAAFMNISRCRSFTIALLEKH